MRKIEISTEVFALIWAARNPGEETEDDILGRILRTAAPSSDVKPVESKRATEEVVPRRNDVLWRDDIVDAFNRLGGEADLHEIYRVVREIRSSGGRSIPKSTDAVIRRELENNSSDSESFTAQRDLFRSVNGIGEGRWALR